MCSFLWLREPFDHQFLRDCSEIFCRCWRLRFDSRSQRNTAWELTVFADFGEYAVSGDCPPMPVDLDSPVQASWTSSDPSAVTINSGPIGPVLGYNGTVTCLSAAGLVTATASYVSPDFPGRTLIASTQFTCQ
jgi:hypothetical protein